MDRYQFEDLISDYIENQLDLKSRKEFEKYLDSNPEAKKTVETVRQTILSMNRFKVVSTSSTFMSSLQKRVKTESIRDIAMRTTSKRTIFGFEPLYAAISAFTFAGIIFVGSQIFTSNNSQQGMDPSMLGASRNSQPQLQQNNSPAVNENYFVGQVMEDSSGSEQDSLKPLSQDLQNRIQYVKNPR